MNHLPCLPKHAPIWLQAVVDVAEFAHEPAAVWIAREFVREPKRVKPDRLKLISLWAWFSTQPATFGHELLDRRWTPNMRVDSALEAAREWRTKIALHVNLGSQPIVDMWLQAQQVAGYDFVPLDSIPAIIEEAAAMKNCLRTYGHSLAHNHSRLWSVRRDGARVATLQVAGNDDDPLLNIVQLKGFRNARVRRDVWWAARQWLHTHNLLQIEQGQRNWGTVPLHRATWLSIWRPYWLAKRRIPKWLPIAPSRFALRSL